MEDLIKRTRLAQNRVDPMPELRYPILDEYFKFRQKIDPEIIEEIKKCQWCDRFKEHKFMVCLHCGRGLT